MSSPPASDELVRDVLTSSRRIAIVGASTRGNRASNRVMRFLIEQGYEVFPINPNTDQEELFGRKIYKNLADVPEPIDMVDVFRRASAAGAVCDDAIAIGAKAVWMQLGVVNEDGAERAREAGLKVVMNRCPRIEMPRLEIEGPGSSSDS